jgi:branched-chain amino acid transport system ATP-binding protein
MQRVCRERSCAVLLVEHDVGFVMEQCDTIVALNLGEIIAVGSPEEVRGDAAVQEAYLG